MKLSFRVSFHKNFPDRKSISLNIIIFAFKMQTMTKLNFYCFSKIFSNPRKIFSCLRKIIFHVRGEISKVDSGLYDIKFLLWKKYCISIIRFFYVIWKIALYGFHKPFGWLNLVVNFYAKYYKTCGWSAFQLRRNV